jgi:hypothetical protein
MRHPFYTLYGVLLLAWLGFTAYTRTPFWAASVNELRNVPKSVRDNPGAYRSIYGANSRYTGGK